MYAVSMTNVKYTLKQKRNGAIHIDGFDARTTGGGNDMGDHISYYAKSACAALSKSGYWAKLATFDTPAEALAKAEKLGKVCASCRRAAEAHISEAAQ